MGDYTNLPVSDGTGDAALMHVDADRVIGSHTLSVDSVSNVPAGHCIVTVGTLLASGFVDPSTKIDFFGHLDGSDLAIDAFCPGSTDNGNTIGQVAFIKPNTDWANLVAAFIMNASGNGTPEDLTADDLAAATIHAAGLITAASGFTLGGGAFTVPAGAVTRAALEKPHYGALLFSNNGGTVFTNSQVTVPFNEADTTNGVGLTVDTAAHTITTVRDGIYDIQFRFTCIDVASTDFICWIYITVPAVGTYALRRQDQAIGVGQSETFEYKGVPLPAGSVISVQHYNGGGATRHGTVNNGGTDPFINRLLHESLTVTERR